MKDKQIKYLLTLKRKFESIRHDQYIFSEKNPVEGFKQTEIPLLQLYQLINFSLQSIEFKILETVNMSYKKTKNENTNCLVKLEKDEQYTYSQNQMKIQDNQPQINKLIKAQSMPDNSSQRYTDMNISGKKNQNQYNNDQNQEYIEQLNVNIDKCQQIIKNDGKTKKKIVVPLKSKSQNLIHLNEQNIKQGIIITNQQKFQINPLKNEDNRIQNTLEIEQNKNQTQNSILNLNQLSSISQNDIDSNFLFHQKNPIQQVNHLYLNNRQNLVEESNNQNVFSNNIPQALSSLSLKHQNSVEIKQLFIDEKEEQFKIYDSKVQQINDQNDFKQINCDTNIALKKDEKICVEVNDEKNGIDQYLNFETPKKMNCDYYEESEIQDRQNISNTYKKLVVESSIQQIYEQQSEDNESESSQDEGINDQLTKTTNLIRIRRMSNIKQFTNSECKTVKKNQNTKNTIDYSDQTIKYRFCEVTTEKKRQQDLEQYSTNKIDTETKFKKSNNSNKKQCQQNPIEIIANTSNKKISKKLEYKQDEDFRSYVRGPYNFYSEELKKKAIKDYHKYKNLKKAAEINEVKVKNLKRWITVGHKRKEGLNYILFQQLQRGGRKKEDPDMEEKVYQWLYDQYHNHKQSVTRNQIREKALEQSNKKDKFKASKGWLEKFFVRYNCKFMSQQDKLNLENDEQENGDDNQIDLIQLNDNYHSYSS